MFLSPWASPAWDLSIPGGTAQPRGCLMGRWVKEFAPVCTELGLAERQTRRQMK